MKNFAADKSFAYPEFWSVWIHVEQWVIGITVAVGINTDISSYTWKLFTTEEHLLISCLFFNRIFTYTN